MPTGRSRTSVGASARGGAAVACELFAVAKALGVPGRDRRLGIGKRMGRSVWVHRSCADVLPPALLDGAVAAVPGDFGWNVAKLDEAAGGISLIHSPDFDAAHEPSVGDCWVWRPGRPPRLVRPPADPWIYHHRWTMVRDGYEGFDVRAAVSRSILWKSKFGRNASLSSRIGRRSVWLAELAARGLD